MPLTLDHPEAVDVLVLPKKRWTRAECRQLAENQLIDPARYELLDGELVEKVSKNGPHVVTLLIVAELFRRVFGWEHVATESPIDVSAAELQTNEPEPDVIVLRPNFRQYLSRNPCVADLDLVLEVASSSRVLDLGFKAALYARAGIRDYWVVDLDRRRIVVHRQPHPEGYKEILAYSEGESIPLLTPAGVSIEVSQILEA
jgi:Uma2 family endonuclease